MPIKIGQTIAAGFLSLVAQGGVAPYAYSIVSGSLPPGLSLDSATGYITGTIDASIDTSGTTNAGFHGFVGQCEDSDSTIFEDGFGINVEHILVPVADDPLPAEEFLAYKYTFSVTGYTGTLTWGCSGTLPTGLSINSSTGVLSGTLAASTAGDYPVNITVSDSGTGDSISIPVVIEVYESLGGPSSFISLAQISTPFFYDLSNIIGHPQKKTYTTATWISTVPGDVSGVQPTWIKTTTGATINFSGTAPDVGAVSFQVLVTDDAGGETLISVQLFCNYSFVSPFDASGQLGSNGMGAIKIHSSDSSVDVTGSNTSGFADFDLKVTGGGGGTPYGVASGTNTYTVTLGLASYTTGQLIVVKFTNANTSSTVSLNADSLGAKTVLLDGAGPPIGYFLAASTLELVYNGTNFDIIGEPSATSPLTTKGDVYGHSTVDARIPVGADGTVFTADSTQALGVKWASASSAIDLVSPTLFGF